MSLSVFNQFPSEQQTRQYVLYITFNLQWVFNCARSLSVGKTTGSNYGQHKHGEQFPF